MWQQRRWAVGSLGPTRPLSDTRAPSRPTGTCPADSGGTRGCPDSAQPAPAWVHRLTFCDGGDGRKGRPEGRFHSGLDREQMRLGADPREDVYTHVGVH